MITALNVDKLRLDMGDYVLSVQSLHKRIGRRDVLAGIDLDVKRGAFAALVGPAGAGKSLTLACIAGACKPSRGRIRYFGYEIKGRAEERVVRMGIARVQQTPQLFGGMTALETVTVGALLRHPRLARARDHGRAMLALTGLSEVADARVETLDPLDCRLLEIARASATDPQLLLLDDIAAQLEAVALDRLIPVITAVRGRGTTIVLAARALGPFAPLVDSVIEIDSGKTAALYQPSAAAVRAEHAVGPSLA